MSLVFYYSPMSSAVTTHWVLEELGIPYEKVRIDLQAGDQRKPAYLALNPNGKVPLIVHDGTAIFESAAILLYLGETFGVEKKLFPAAGPARGEAFKWVIWTSVTLGDAMSRFQHASSSRIPAERHNAKAAEAAKADVEKHLEILNTALEGKSHLVGDSFSLVDVHVSSWVAYLGMLGFGFDMSRWGNIETWKKRCTERPGFARSMQP